RLTRHLNKGTPNHALNSYLNTVRKWTPDEPVIHIDDSDIVKPHGYKFEALGTVRDGSKSSNTKNVIETGYNINDECAIKKSKHHIMHRIPILILFINGLQMSQ